MKFTAAAMLMLGLATAPGLTSAQTIYRCGSTYSQAPCPNAQRIEADDARSAAQRLDADRVVNSDRRLAADMRRDRLADEAARRPAAAASLSGAPHAPTAAVATRDKPKTKKKASHATRVAKPFVARGTAARSPRSRG